MYNTDEIFQEYGEFIYKYLLRISNNKELSEELMQETFYRAIKSIDKFDGTCKFSTWLCEIARHLWLQQLRKNKVRNSDVLNENIISTNRKIEEEICLKEEKMEVFKKIHMLNEVAKEIVLLRITGAFSFKEIGEIFGKSENWARITFYRAKKKIMKG